MKKYLSLIILFSLFLLQIHADIHVHFNEHQKNASCVICEIHSHQSIIEPTNLDLNLTAQLAFEEIFLISENNFIPKSSISLSNTPRGPPVI